MNKKQCRITISIFIVMLVIIMLTACSSNENIGENTASVIQLDTEPNPDEPAVSLSKPLNEAQAVFIMRAPQDCTALCREDITHFSDLLCKASSSYVINDVTIENRDIDMVSILRIVNNDKTADIYLFNYLGEVYVKAEGDYLNEYDSIAIEAAEAVEFIESIPTPELFTLNKITGIKSIELYANQEKIQLIDDTYTLLQFETQLSGTHPIYTGDLENIRYRLKIFTDKEEYDIFLYNNLPNSFIFNGLEYYLDNEAKEFINGTFKEKIIG